MTVEVGPDPFNPPDETVIFVPKTDEELGTDKEHVERLKAVSSSTSIWGTIPRIFLSKMNPHLVLDKKLVSQIRICTTSK